MKKVYAVAHTHWDFEWYFSRQEARVQFIFHMDDVFDALKNNNLDYYMLDGQMSIVDDYLAVCPDKKPLLEKYVKAGRLFVGPWYTQIDEMVTSGESIVRNLRLGFKLSNELGATTKIGYLPDSFGQGQDMPKIYNGFGIKHAVFWRGLPANLNARYFYWDSNDGSEVLTANIKNGYYAGVDLIENDKFSELMKKISTDTNVNDLVLPIGGDQRAVDYNLKQRVQIANKLLDGEYQVIESNYPEYFKALSRDKNIPTLNGEFIDPSDSKIHRGIYSSRYDLKQMYDLLEQRMTYQVEPLAAMAQQSGIEYKSGLIDEIWKTIARGQAHDSSGGSNSDKTNSDIFHRAVVADELSQSLKNYLLRKLSISIESEDDLILWNPLPVDVEEIREIEITTLTPNFELRINESKVEFDVIEQTRSNAATIRRDQSQMDNEFYYVNKIAAKIGILATDWISIQVIEGFKTVKKIKNVDFIENEFYRLNFVDQELQLQDKVNNISYKKFIEIEDGGDEGDTYDYSPAFKDWILNLDFTDATVTCNAGRLINIMNLSGEWKVPKDLSERAEHQASKVVQYNIKLQLDAGLHLIKFKMNINNKALDHRMRLILNPRIKSQYSFSDTPFGVAKRPVIDPRMQDWKDIGYREEPTAMRPMIHFANIHDSDTSCSFITNGMKDFQVIGENYDQLAITLFRGVGFLGRPDLKRRPGDASGLTMRMVPTPDSQLRRKLTFEGAIVVGQTFDPNDLQASHLKLSQQGLFYQKQSINRFTTPLQYFMMNPIQHQKVTHQQLLGLGIQNLTMSSFGVTKDQTGVEVRLYNPTDNDVTAPGKLKLAKESNIVLLDLEGNMLHSVANDQMEYHLEDFKPGEIRTYGIYPID